MILHLFIYPIQFLLTYGYLGLFLWSVLEGEIGLMLAGWLARHGEVFSFDKVVLVATLGALIGDTITFSIGRFFESKVKRWLDSHPTKKEKALRWIREYGPYVIIFERFIYGTHIPVLLLFGMSGYSYRRFYFFDIIGVTLWALTFTFIGYFFGDRAIQLILFIQKNIFTLLIFGAFALFYYQNTQRWK